MLVHEKDLVVHLGVTHRDRRLIGQRGEEIRVVTEEGIAGPLRPDGKEADDAIALDQGHEHLAAQPPEVRERRDRIGPVRLTLHLVPEEQPALASSWARSGRVGEAWSGKAPCPSRCARSKRSSSASSR